MAYYPDVVAQREVLLPLLQQRHTPIFLCERANVVARYRALEAALVEHWGPHIISYSFKTNYHIAESDFLRELGVWAEVVSAREYRMARTFGYCGSQIIFNGPHKPEESLLAAVGDRALININDHDELDRLLKMAAPREQPLGIGIRVSSTLPRVGHSRFGFSLENAEATEAVHRIRDHAKVRLTAVHTHVYGDTDDPAIYACAADRLGAFIRQHVLDDGLKYIDMGGGFPAHSPQPKSRSSWAPQPIDVYIRHIADSLGEFYPNRDGRPTLVVEPGRYLVCDGVVLVTRVVHVKKRHGCQVVNCDGSISMVPLTHYSPQIIRAYTPELAPRDHPLIPTSIHGVTCRENDQLYEGRFPVVSPGDLLVHFAAGAYNSNLSPDFIFASPETQIF